MRRYLVLTNEAARHPFRRTLPESVTRLSEEVVEPLKLFGRAYLGTFVVVFTFLS